MQKKSVHLNQYSNYYYKIGFHLFGPLLYEFCHFIHDYISSSKILFVSREGEFFQKCFHTLYPNIQTDMIYLSRKSVISGVSSSLLKNMNVSQFSNYVSVKRNETVKEFLKRFNLNPDKYQNSLKQENIHLDNLLSSINLDHFFNHNDELTKDLNINSNLFSKYLDTVLEDDNILIDIGWKGSMQDLLSQYLQTTNSNKKIKGLYLGVMNDQNKKGFLFQENNKVCQNILNYSGLLEIIFMPNYGSVIGYQEENKKIVPIFDQCEFTQNSLKIIQDIQNGIIEFIKTNQNRIDINQIITTMNKLGNYPSLLDIKHFEKLDFYDNGYIYSLIETPKFGNLLNGFLNTKWKTAYLKKLFKIKFPYSKIVIFLRNLKDK